MSADIVQKLSSLGCAFAAEEKGIVADPEETIIETLDSFWVDKKMFTMLVALLRFRIHHLINTKRLQALSTNLDDNKKILLAVLAMKIWRFTGDERFNQLAHRLKKRGAKLTNYPSNYADPFYTKRRGLDQEFRIFKVELADFFDEQPEKKLKSLKRIYSENLWLKLRAIVGPEFRADAIYLRCFNSTITQVEVAHILRCHKSSISRIWSSLKSFDDLIPLI